MNEFERQFVQDCREKKNIAHGSAHMKRGSKSRKCALPSDHMTASQWKKRNGDVMSYKLDEPCTIKEFYSWPRDIQKEYVENLRGLYGVTNKMVSDMWGVSPQRVSQVLSSIGESLGRGVNKTKKVDDQLRRDAMWSAFCNGVVGGKPSEVETKEETPVPVPVSEVYTERAPLPENETPVIRHTEVCFTGDFTAETLGEYVKSLSFPEGEITVRLVVDR